MYSYHVDVFVPPASGCSGGDSGWDTKRCAEFAAFLNAYAAKGWKLHSSEYREVTMKGCNGRKGAWLVCVFESQKQ